MSACRVVSAPALTRLSFGGFLYLALALLLTGWSAKPALADGSDRVSFGQRIVINQDETVGDVVCFFCSIEVHGNVEGDVVTFLGGFKGNGNVHGDLVSLLGDVNLGSNSTVDGQMVLLGGKLRRSAEVRLSQEQVILPGSIFFIPLILLAAIVWGITRLIRRPVYFRPVR